MPKIVCISDTHESHEDIDVPDGDILIHAGDITYRGTIHALMRFNTWLGTLPHKHKIVVAGNHDWIFQKDPALAKTIISNATYLQNSGCRFEGLNFWGSPATPEFHSWAFNYKRGNEIKKFWDMIPMHTDVVISHGPMHGVLDEVRGENVGCEELYKAIQRVQPKLHVCGHIHSGWGQYMLENGTHCVNASIMSDYYHPINSPIVVDL